MSGEKLGPNDRGGHWPDPKKQTPAGSKQQTRKEVDKATGKFGSKPKGK